MFNTTPNLFLALGLAFITVGLVVAGMFLIFAF